MLGSRLRDITSGFRGYRADALRSLDLSAVHSHGYSFQIEMALRAHAAGFRVVEVPITFVERTQGASKMSRTIVLEALWRVPGWALEARNLPAGIGWHSASASVEGTDQSAAGGTAAAGTRRRSVRQPEASSRPMPTPPTTSLG